MKVEWFCSNLNLFLFKANLEILEHSEVSGEQEELDQLDFQATRDGQVQWVNKE